MLASLILILVNIEAKSCLYLLVCVSSGYSLLRDPHHNKGLAFTEKERDAHYLRGLLPPVVISQELQVCSLTATIELISPVMIFCLCFCVVMQEKKLMHSIRQYQLPLHKYMAMMELEVLQIIQAAVF